MMMMVWLVTPLFSNNLVKYTVIQNTIFREPENIDNIYDIIYVHKMRANNKCRHAKFRGEYSSSFPSNILPRKSQKSTFKRKFPVEIMENGQKHGENDTNLRFS